MQYWPLGSHASWLSIARKYQFMEVNTQKRSAGLKDKIPEIQQTLGMVRYLKTRKVRLFLWFICCDTGR